MESGMLGRFIFLMILLLLSGFFSAAETSLTSLNKIRMQAMAAAGVKNAAIVSKLINNPNKLLGAILVGNNIVNIGASALATSLAIKLFGNSGVGIATGVMTFMLLVFGEITPKSLATKNALQVALWFAKPINLITKALGPILFIIMKFTDWLVRILSGKTKQDQPSFTEEEIKTIVSVSQQEGVLEGDEKQMIYNIFEFGDSQVSEIMTPRTDMVAIELKANFDEIKQVFKYEQYSRIPVYNEVTDNIVGILTVKDLILYEGAKEDFNIEQYIRQPFYTYEFKRITELFEDMRSNRETMAVVLDEYGVTAGIITMENIVEEIVGDIQDEYDAISNEIEKMNEQEYVVDGGTKIYLVNEILGTNIETEDFDSIGGYVFGNFGRLPKAGEHIELGNIKFIIMEIDRNRIEKLRIILSK